MSDTTISIPEPLMEPCEYFEHWMKDVCPVCGGFGYVLTAEGETFLKVVAHKAALEIKGSINGEDDWQYGGGADRRD